MMPAARRHIRVVASYPGPGRLHLAFTPPIRTWRFPVHLRVDRGRTVALDACRDAVRTQSTAGGSDAPIAKIEAAVETALAALVADGSIALP